MSYAPTEQEHAMRVDLAAAFRLSAHYNLHEAIGNHFSAVLPDGEHFLVNAFGEHFTEITASSLLVCDLDGNVVAGDGVPAASAKHIHAPIHRRCPHAKVLMHTHQPYATALTMIGEGRLEMALQTSARFYGRIGYDTEYDGVALDDEVGDRMAKVLGDSEVLFLGNHGVMTAAPTIAQAWDDLYYLERSAHTQIAAMSTGRPLSLLSSDMLERVATQTNVERFELGYIDKHFEAQKRLLDRIDPSYRQ